MFYLLIPKAKPRTISPNVFCLGDGIGVTSQLSVEEVKGQIYCTRVHWNSKLFYCGLWHFTTIIKPNLTFYVLFAGHEKSVPLPGLACGLLFELRRTHAYGSCGSRALLHLWHLHGQGGEHCWGKQLPKGTGELKFKLRRDITSWVKAVLPEEKLVFLPKY